MRLVTDPFISGDLVYLCLANAARDLKIPEKDAQEMVRSFFKFFREARKRTGMAGFSPDGPAEEEVPS